MLAGAAAVLAAERLPESDGEGLLSTLNAAYARMEAQRETPLPEREGDRIVVRPDAADAGRAIVFLHGYGGSFQVQCWHVAHLLRGYGGETYCPSVGADGRWWTARGRRVYRSLRAELAADGVSQALLVGLSNGARGAAVLAQELEVDGVVLLSGGAGRRPPRRTPVLTASGRRDTMFAPAAARGYARRAGRRWGTFVPLDGGHFAFLGDYESLAPAADAWLRRNELAAGSEP